MNATMRSAWRGAALAGLVALGLAGCSEPPQVTVYEQGSYQGKADTRPWEEAAFKGDKAAWEAALRNRARGQNEYNRAQ